MPTASYGRGESVPAPAVVQCSPLRSDQRALACWEGLPRLPASCADTSHAASFLSLAVQLPLRAGRWGYSRQHESKREPWFSSFWLVLRVSIRREVRTPRASLGRMISKAYA